MQFTQTAVDEDVVPQDPLKKGEALAEGMIARLKKTDSSANLACIQGWSFSDKGAWSVSAVVAAMKKWLPRLSRHAGTTYYILCAIH
jgi:hypothetical protein